MLFWNMETIAREKVMIPSPPNCMRRAMIIFPKRVKSRAVSFTVSPVTQTADVDVKSASTNPMPDTVAAGLMSRNDPIKISAMKLASTFCTGVR
jgi:hypothetical protein